MGFFVVGRKERVAVPPREFGPRVSHKIESLLRQQVEGRPAGRWGFTIFVMKIAHIGDGKLNETTGFAEFDVEFSSLVLRPFKNEILLAEVTGVSENGFFASAGPLDIFVSRHLMGSDFKLVPSVDGLPSWKSEIDESRIAPNELVRLKITGLRLGLDEISVVGTIKEDFLGPVET